MKNPTDRETKIAELRAILREASAPPRNEIPDTETTVFPLDEGSSYFDASPAQVASRVSSLTLAAKQVMTGDELCDRLLRENIYIDLLDTAAWLARKLAHYHDDLDMAKRQRVT